MTYYFEIAGIRIRCDYPFELHVTQELQPFCTEEGDWQYRLTFSPVTQLVLPSACSPWRGSYYECGADRFYCMMPQYPPYARSMQDPRDPDHRIVTYLSGSESSLNYAHNLIDILSLESFLLHFDGLLLHASVVNTDFGAVLFTGPSGIGKSTQASLWTQFEHADILNGDRAALRKHEDGWNVWGLPYAGSSGIYRNISAPVCAVVSLSQGMENSIRRLSASDVLRAIYPEFMIHRWDPDYVIRALCLIEDLISKVPVYALQCRPDRAAVDLLKFTLSGGLPR